MTKASSVRQFVAVLATMCLSGVAWAGPLEDGVKAYSKADYAKASRLLEPLAQNGDTDAQYTMAMMYQKGQGVTENKVNAYMWYALAARKGDKDAALDRDQVASTMTPQQIDEGKKLVADWSAKAK
jgi:TPR repeat protein